uniref:WS/DGAT domain-containing protein n=1 Tax=Nocardioides sp. TaxID=35761 RepID=UPI002B27039E
ALLASAIKESVTAPTAVIDTAGIAVAQVRQSVDATRERAAQVTRALTGRRPRRRSAMFGPLSQQRRVITLTTDLADYRRVRETHGGTINDVILATITGGLRGWFMTRTASLSGVREIRAVVPVSVIDDELEATSLGSQIAAHFVTLPVGEASPIVRLHQVSYSFQAHKDTGRSVAANRLAGIAGFAPTTFHAIGSRVAAEELRRGYHLSVTNVPGPQAPLYAAGARMLATYPVPPLLPGHPLSIAVTSYDGKVFYGINADRDLLPDVDIFKTCLAEALEELLTVSTSKRAPRGRKRATTSRATKK